MVPFTVEDVRDLLRRRSGGVLSFGAHPEPEPTGLGQCSLCAREALILLRRERGEGVPWITTLPNASATAHAVMGLNDLHWPSDEDRTAACLPLVLRVEAHAARGWVNTFADAVVHLLLPIALEAFPDSAQACALSGIAGLPAIRAAATGCHPFAERAMERLLAVPDPPAMRAGAICTAIDHIATSMVEPLEARAKDAKKDEKKALLARAKELRGRVLRFGVAVFEATHAGGEPWRDPFFPLWSAE